jgi:hypothetical protein
MDIEDKNTSGKSVIHVLLITSLKIHKIRKILSNKNEHPNLNWNSKTKEYSELTFLFLTNKKSNNLECYKKW